MRLRARMNGWFATETAMAWGENVHAGKRAPYTFEVGEHSV